MNSFDANKVLPQNIVLKGDLFRTKSFIIHSSIQWMAILLS